mmetsp:Transcript_17424/g.40090  ORF Transcript_17424/g.40090 Transcript_17424/m.40090 type:complete len:348 (-) Transcript_17424:47-1090(-)
MPSEKKRKAKGEDAHDSEPKLMKGQSIEDREKLRKKQRDLADQIQSNRNAIGDVNSGAFAEVREANNQLGAEVRFMRESVLDVQNLRAITAATTKQAAALALANQAVSVDKLIRELRKKGCVDDSAQDEGDSEDGDFDWAQLGKAVGGLWATVPPVEFLCGPITKPEVARKGRPGRRAKRGGEEEVEEEQPEDVTSKDEELVESTQKRLTVLKDKLSHMTEGGNPVDFFSFLVDPRSFTQTVENVFDFSFLVKQGTGALALDDAGLPVIQHVNTSGSALESAEDQVSTQLVMSLCPADLRRAVKAFGCAGKGVPHRTDQTYDTNFEGIFVGKRAGEPKGKGKARASS